MFVVGFLSCVDVAGHQGRLHSVMLERLILSFGEPSGVWMDGTGVPRACISAGSIASCMDDLRCCW
jgi:hypothetical protein